MPRARPGFSMIEVLIVLALMALIASAAFLVLESPTQEAQLAKVQAELSRMRKDLLARALLRPDQHFRSLEEALGLEEPPLDPWGNPYLLLHAIPTHEYDLAAEYWNDGETEDLYSTHPEASQHKATHYLASVGPPLDAPGWQAAAAEGLVPELRVALPLGKDRPVHEDPYYKSPYQSSPTTGVPQGPTVVTGMPAGEPGPSQVTLQFFDFSANDIDHVRVSLNGTVLFPDLLLSPPPGISKLVQLRPGPNRLVIQALIDGEIPPCSPAVRVVETDQQYLYRVFAPETRTILLPGPAGP